MWIEIAGDRDEAARLFETYVKRNKFQVQATYNLFRKHGQRVRWAVAMQPSTVVPKHKVITSLAVQWRLAIIDCISKRGMPWVNRCVLCKQDMETHDHLFFKCQFSASIWRGVLNWMGISGRGLTLKKELLWISKQGAKRHWKIKWFSCSICAVTYAILKERNRIIFEGFEREYEKVIQYVKELYGFPPRFTKWVLACVTSSHFSLNINGSVEGFFPGQRGLRQGDPLSPYLFVLCMEVLSRLLRTLPTHPGFSYHPKCVKVKLTHLIFADDLLVFTREDLPSIQAVNSCLSLFAAFSGLKINPMKSSLYFGGVPSQLKKLILSTTGYVEGDLPVRYLGLPLFSSRLTQPMFAPLLDKIRAKISHWANSMLTYAGKIELINSVLFGLQHFWGSSVLLPKGIVKNIQKICKKFLWGIDEGHKRHVFKSWNDICLPRQEGGLGIKEVLSWNKCQMLSWIKKLELDTPTVWMTSAYSWAWGSIIGCRDDLIRPHWRDSLPKGPPFTQHKTLEDGLIYPKHAVISTLAVQCRLPTIDNLCGRGFALANRCALCEQDIETTDHLFFCCPFSSAVWRAIAIWLRATPVSGLHSIFLWYRTHNRGRSMLKRMRRCALCCAIYLIWKERNMRIFKDVASTPSALVWKLQYLVYLRARSHEAY
ncbi:uncharacterized protein LOC141629644 [Silene latifolia]|uniref:uncharacterized protein LOC141629644 n=1 Tax=Silene latifolia TaxID=37657 RepID=UPI003D779E6D